MSRFGGGGRLRLREVFGVDPPRRALADARQALFGNEFSPGTEWDLSSRHIFKPQIGIPTWLGRGRPDRRLPIYNFFNRNARAPGARYSVKVRDCRDWMGGRWTYDSHHGTDFACAVGTPVVAPAPGVVLRDRTEIDYGGLKVCIDHGRGLFTTSGHLSRSFVTVGQKVSRGEVIGLSGASGLEFMLFFPWVSPHVHFNTWLNGTPMDPFAIHGEVGLWRRRNDPVPHDGSPVAEDDSFTPSEWDPAGIAANIAAIRDPHIAARVVSLEDPALQAAEIIVMQVYRGAMFRELPTVYATPGEPRAVLDLPFRAADTPGVAFPGR